jgi:hypothetical protein
MQPLSSSITIEASADHVWSIVAHRFDRIGEWATVVPSSAAATVSTPLDAPIAGRVCQTGMRAAPEVTETVVAYDESAKTLTYQATAGLPALVTLARNTWRVTPLTEEQTQVTHAGQLEVRGLLGALAKRRLRTRAARDGRHLLDDLKHFAEHGRPSPRKLRDPVAAVGTLPASRHLRAALRTNAVFSLASALALIAGAWWSLILPLVGVPVAGFGLLAAGLAAAPAEPLRRRAVWVIVADAGWVGASITVLTLVHLSSTVGIAVGALAAVVAGLAGWQAAGLAVLRRDDPLADLEVIEVSRRLPIAANRIWPLLTDHQLYGRLAPNLSAVEVVSQPGETLRRRCTNTGGQQWQESCTLWQEGRRFAVEVDPTDYPYPIHTMRGLWQVDPDPLGSIVTMRFVYQAMPTVRGGLFAIVLRLLSTRAIRSILDGWQREATRPS